MWIELRTSKHMISPIIESTSKCIEEMHVKDITNFFSVAFTNLTAGQL